MALNRKQRSIVGLLERWLARPNEPDLERIVERLEAYLASTRRANGSGGWWAEITRRLGA